VDCEEAEVTKADGEMLEKQARLLRDRAPRQVQEVRLCEEAVDYDSLEPSERKLVL